MAPDTIICIQNLIPREISYRGPYQTDPTPDQTNYDRLMMLIQQTTDEEVGEFKQQNYFTVNSVHQVTTPTTSDDNKRPEVYDSHGSSIEQDNEGPSVTFQEHEVPAAGTQKDMVQSEMLKQKNDEPVVYGKSTETIDSLDPSELQENEVRAFRTQKDELSTVLGHESEISAVSVDKSEIEAVLAPEDEMLVAQETLNVSIVDSAAIDEAEQREKMVMDFTGDKLELEEKLVSIGALKSIVKISKLCFLLDTNVKELKSFYENGGYSYSKEEHAILNSGLQSLVEDMPKLLNELRETVGGNREKIRKVIDTYCSYEPRYRALRKIGSMKTKPRKKTSQKPHGDDTYGLCTQIKEYANEVFNGCCIP